MVMPVTPGGAYFGFYSNFADDYRGSAVSYADAVSAASAPGARDVADLDVPDSIGSASAMGGHPMLQRFTGDGTSMEVLTTYDNGYWDDMPPGGSFAASYFLVELQGPNASEFVVEGDAFRIEHYVSADGGQSIYLNSSVDGLLTGLTRIRVWRAEAFPGDPLPEPPSNFWTGFIGSREII